MIETAGGSKDIAWVDYKTSQQSQASCAGKCDDLFHLGLCLCTDPLCSSLKVKSSQNCTSKFFYSVFLISVFLGGCYKAKENPSELRLMHGTS